jgi:hypothetical protein
VFGDGLTASKCDRPDGQEPWYVMRLLFVLESPLCCAEIVNNEMTDFTDIYPLSRFHCPLGIGKEYP